MNKKEKVTKIVIEIIDTIDNSIMLNDKEILSISSVEQLTAFKIILLDVLDRINNNTIQPKNERNLGISKIIIDQWPFSLTLGALIIKAENLYKEI